MRFRDIFASNQIFALTAKGLEGLKSFFFVLLIANAFGPGELGSFVYVISAIAIISIVSEFRLHSALVLHGSQKEVETSKLIGSAFLINLFFALVGLLITLSLIYLFDDRDEQIGLAVMSLAFFLKIPRAVKAELLAREQAKFIAVSEIFASMVLFGAAFFAFYGKAEFVEYFYVRVLDYLILALGFLYVFHVRVLPLQSLRVDRALCKKLVFESAPLVLSGAAMMLVQKSDVILIKHILDVEAAGIYSAASTVAMIFALVPLTLSEALAPRMFRTKKLSMIEVDRVKYQFSRLIILTGLVLSVLLFLFGGLFIELFYSEEFKGGGQVLAILSLIPLLVALGSCAGQIIVYEGSQNGVFYKSVLGCIVGIALHVILIPIFGLVGASLATVIGFLISNFLSHLLFPKYRRIFFLQCRVILLR